MITFHVSQKISMDQYPILLHLIYLSNGYLSSSSCIIYNGVDLYTCILLPQKYISTFSIICNFSKLKISHTYVHIGLGIIARS